MKCHYKKYDNFIITVDSENLRMYIFLTVSWLFHEFRLFVLNRGGGFLALCGNNNNNNKCNKVKGLHYQNEMCSLMISKAICLVVKVDAIDEIFTRSIILKKKSQSPAGCCAALVPHRLRQSPGRVPIDVMETLKLLRMIHVYAVLLSSPTQIEVDFNPDNL